MKNNPHLDLEYKTILMNHDNIKGVKASRAHWFRTLPYALYKNFEKNLEYNLVVNNLKEDQCQLHISFKQRNYNRTNR